MNRIRQLIEAQYLLLCYPDQTDRDLCQNKP